ncbi:MULTISPECIES: cold-shock protein [Shigella]|uniref:Cold-shock protein n=3 Tax=Enterobacteriaceae TaxID=543 RepID=A0A2S8D6K8_SHIDY|nr:MULTISPECIES: cold-shock protein [Shigella]EIA9571317.1 cold-shock protein [Shigella sonnei]AKI69535.1 cold-shock protein [Shigella boydii]EFV6089182.1 cold-shock protein [Shigella dysenteriae]EFW0169153.1 cold-shock protein [Shigella dysenteriae]EJY9928736.1 cold-shock protein [Shigella boydii]
MPHSPEKEPVSCLTDWHYPRGAFFISALFFFNAVCIVSDNLLIIESFGEMAYNISYLTRVPGTNTLLACCCLLRPEEVNSEY